MSIDRFYPYAIVYSIAILYGSWRNKYLRLPFQLLLFLLIYSFAGEIFVNILGKQINTGGPYYHFHVMLEYGFLAIIYYSSILKQYRWGKYWLYLSVIAVLSFNLLNSFYWQPITESALPTNGILVSSTFVLFMGLITYTSLLNYSSNTPLIKTSVFWFNTGTILFYLTGFFIFALFKKYMSSDIYSDIVKNILYISNLIMYSSYGISLYMEVSTNKKNNFTDTPESSPEKP